MPDAVAPPADAAAPASRPATGTPRPPGGRPPGRIPALWLALLAAPMATSANGPVLILADIAADLGVPVSAATWLTTAFGCALAVGTPLMAGLLRRRGPHLALYTGAALVLAGTLVVAFAPWLPLLAAGRAAQALGGAGLIATAMNLAGSVRRMGVITAGFGMCGAVGPLAGSLIADATSWHLTLTLSAVALLAVAPVARRLPDPAPADPAARAADRFDALGALLLTALVTSLVFATRFPAAAGTGAVLAAGLLALRLRARPDGFVPVALLRTPAFLLASAVAFALATSYFALLYAVPDLLRRDTGWTDGRIGVGQMAALLVGSALSWVLASVADRMGRRAVLAVLLGLGALAPVTAALTPWAPLLLAVATLAILAASAGQAVLGVLATGAAPAPLRPIAIGLFNLCYQLGMAVGPAVLALLALG
ncbi:MFS transporter [Allostreptomyces psammosilenae]|uniref:Putative MFS family arabinose efflux permease n=1 Tax=Allostreptomyces psammosilenae TaxID=1892865 RepID=A0A853A7W7_9ACTN|nr:MFS transporter [Allostreptomyces psammosilenae]NYI06751.1 putative MFS family arabinose efflux permease [Allostreptomyces psammosilenae]